MERQVVTEKYIFDEMGRVCGRQVVTEFYSNNDILGGSCPEVIDIEPNVPQPEEETLYVTPDKE